MEIKGRVHLFFEQSGTFKNEFIGLGYEAFDYDIQNNFGETDYTDDLFKAIEDAYEGKPSLFDNISEDDLIMAFFPCIYFEAVQATYYSLNSHNVSKLSQCDRIDVAIKRLEQRTYYHGLLYKLLWIINKRSLRLIVENPATKPHYLIGTQNFSEPTYIDKNRMLRGDYFVKPTAYWFFNCEPTNGFTEQNDKQQKIVMKCKKGDMAGLCSEERSMISSDYARNFICDLILGKKQNIGHLQIFEPI